MDNEMVQEIKTHVQDILYKQTSKEYQISDGKIRKIFNNIINVETVNQDINQKGIFNHYTQKYDTSITKKLTRDYYIQKIVHYIIEQVNRKIYQDYMPVMFDTWKVKVNFERPVQIRDGDANQKLKNKRLEGTGAISIPGRI